MAFKEGDKVFFDQASVGAFYTRKAGTIRFTIDEVKYFATILREHMEGESSNGLWSAAKQ